MKALDGKESCGVCGFSRRWPASLLLHTNTFRHRGRTRQIAILPQVFVIKHHFVRKGCDGKSSEIAIFLLQFLVIEPHFVRKGCAGRFATRNFTSVFGDQTSFRAKGLRRRLCNSQVYLSFWRSNLFSCEMVAPGREKSQFYLSFWRSNVISCERVAFRAVSLALPRAFQREIEKKERARGQESKRAREQEGKM